ncbi:MAG: cytochrome b [Euryhalocaulis sp.]|uniref:cytochrome b n=1 Tax=Euryhalocaulis sp. TaxID=2744307 RepID=UPI00183631AF|nr:cytochrome b [Euryhalocaulis sp.]MBA4801090.1 cytochrome b [Euryhalocaulis sp.]
MTGTRRYNAVAMTLHWLIAIAIIGMIFFGWWAGDLPNSTQKLNYFQIHKSVGLTILVLSVARLIWRLTHKTPPYPEQMKAWEKTAATAVHWAFYVLIIAMPLAGWLMVSSSPLGIPTRFFFLFEWPHLPILPGLPRDTKETLDAVFENVHSKMAWVILALLALHVGAALKHQFVERIDLLQRMIPIPFSKK